MEYHAPDLSSQKSEQTLQKIQRQANWLLFLSVVTILLLLFFYVWCWLFPTCTCSRCMPCTAATAQTDEVLTGQIPNLSEEEKQQLTNQNSISDFTVQAVSIGTIKPEGRELSLTVANFKSNQQDCRFRIVLEGKILYVSPVLPPDSYMTTETLSEPISSGTYPAQVEYLILDQDGDISGEMVVEVTIQCK